MITREQQETRGVSVAGRAAQRLGIKEGHFNQVVSEEEKISSLWYIIIFCCAFSSLMILQCTCVLFAVEGEVMCNLHETAEFNYLQTTQVKRVVWFTNYSTENSICLNALLHFTLYITICICSCQSLLPAHHIFSMYLNVKMSTVG